MDPATLGQGPVAASEVECFWVDPLAPRMIVAVGEDEEQALDLDLAAGLQEVGKQFRA